jgi:hypothetical protein
MDSRDKVRTLGTVPKTISLGTSIESSRERDEALTVFAVATLIDCVIQDQAYYSDSRFQLN